MTISHSEIEVGDVVCLAGTPMRMIVSKQRGGFSHCKWYDAEGNENEYPFQTAVLEKQTGKVGGRFPGRR